MNVNEAIAAVKSNPPSKITRTPWGLVHCIVVDADGLTVCEASFSDAAHIAAAVNAAPVLIAEVERLQTVVEAARVAVEKWPGMEHSEFCRGWFVPGDDRTECTCGAWHHEKALADLRRALGLEG